VLQDEGTLLIGEGLGIFDSMGPHETEIKVHFEVTIQARFRIRYDAYNGVIQVLVYVIELFQDEQIGPDDASPIESLVVQIQPSVERSLFIQEEPLKLRGDENRFHREGNNGPESLFIPVEGWKDKTHKTLHQVPVPFQYGEILNGSMQFWCLTEHLSDVVHLTKPRGPGITVDLIQALNQSLEAEHGAKRIIPYRLFHVSSPQITYLIKYNTKQRMFNALGL